MTHDLFHVLADLLVVLGSAVAVLLFGQRVRLPPMVGFIVCGVLIGPAGLGLVADVETVELMAEIGVVFLLFTIGLELSLAKLRAARRAFLLAGPLQAVLTGVVAFGVARLLGVAPVPAVVTSFVAILSSTAVVLRLYADRGELQTPHGQVTLGVLLFQDILVVPMIVVLPLLAGAEAGLGDSMLRIGLALAAVLAAFAVARAILPRLLDSIARTRVREVFVLSAVLLGLGMAYLTGRLGLSMALGAFLAGVAAADTHYRHQLTADIAPFRDLFTSVFFVSIGMLLVVPADWFGGAVILALATLFIGGKLVATFLAVRLSGFAARTATMSSFGLAQVGEFSFLLLVIAQPLELVGPELESWLLTSAGITLVAAPFLVRFVAPAAGRLVAGTDGHQQAPEELTNHVVVVGYGLTGTILGQVLNEVRVPFAVVDLDASCVKKAQEAGHVTLFGDASRRDLLRAARIEQARVLVVAISDPPATRRIVATARELNTNVLIAARALVVGEIQPLRSLGANWVVALEFEGAIEIYQHVLESFHIPPNTIRAQSEILRGDGYEVLRADRIGHGVSERILEALAQGATEVLRINRGSSAIGKSLSDLELRSKTGASVIAIVRGSKSWTSPDPHQTLDEGDDLVVVGGHNAIQGASELLGPVNAEEPPPTHTAG